MTGATNVTLPTTGTLITSAVTTLSSLVSVGTITTGTWNATVVAGQYGGTGVANTGKTITLGGNLTTSGAFASTFTMTNTTTVTFPTTGTLATLAGTETFTNKRISPRVVTDGSTSGTLTPTSDTADQYQMLGLTGSVTIAAASGTPTAGQPLILRFKDNGTGRSLTWNAIYVPVGVTLPTTTVANKLIYVGMRWNATSSQWDVLAVSSEA